MNDIEIIKCVQTGDGKPYALLVEKYHRQLLNFIYRLVDDERIVEDIAQEVFLSVYKSMRDFELGAGTPFSAWLFIVARNRCISELRKKSRLNVPLEDTMEFAARGNSPEQAVIANERLEAISASLDQLPEPYKSTLLKTMDGASLNEIALGDGVSPGTVKSRIFRAKGKMKSLLSEYFGGQDDERL